MNIPEEQSSGFSKCLRRNLELPKWDILFEFHPGIFIVGNHLKEMGLNQMTDCPFCPPAIAKQGIVFANSLCLFLQQVEPILIGSGLIVPKAHRETAFDLTAAEWNATFDLLQKVKTFLDQKLAPDGYNVGWNCGRVGGQEVFHAHLHVIPRYKDEPLAGKGIRYWIKQEANRRKQDL